MNESFCRSVPPSIFYQEGMLDLLAERIGVHTTAVANCMPLDDLALLAGRLVILEDETRRGISLSDRYSDLLQSQEGENHGQATVD